MVDVSNPPSLTNVVIAGNKPSRVPLVVKGAAGQTADVQQWTNDVDSVIASVFPTGLYTKMLAAEGIEAGSADTGRVPIVVKGAVGQIASLLQLQNSAGANLVVFTADGQLVANSLIRSGIGFQSPGHGATILASPGANQGKLYFRNGTNAGTLRLACRAGAAGAEVTIFDNIPQ